MSDISPSSIRTTRKLEEQINACQSQAEVQELLRQAAIDQKLVRRDWDPNILTPNDPGTAPRGYAKTVTVNGVKHILESSDEAGLLAQENEIYRQAMEPTVTTQQTEQPRDTATGRFTAEPVVTDDAKAALSLQFQLGQISASDYLEQSGAVADYLEKQGIPLDELKAQVQEKQEARQVQSWEAATEEFLRSSAGSDWPGGENMNIAGRLIQENGLTDKPSAETLTAVWNHMKENGIAVENKEVTARERISSANSVEQIRELLRPNGSGLFGK